MKNINSGLCEFGVLQESFYLSPSQRFFKEIVNNEIVSGDMNRYGVQWRMTKDR